MKLHFPIFVVLLLIPLVSTAQQAESNVKERAFTANTLSEARAGFMDTYGLVPKDCDPISGIWVCSEFDVSDATPLFRPVVSASVGTTSSAKACTANGPTLGGAQSKFSSQCPWRVRQTCNPLKSGGWACSTDIIVSAINAGTASEIFVEESTSPQPAPEPTVANGVCTAYGATLGGAQTEFSAECPWRVRLTCDPLSTDEWACSTAKMERSTNVLSTPVAPIVSGNATPETAPIIATVDTTVPETVAIPTQASDSDGVLKIQAENVAYNGSLWRLSEGGLVYTGPNRYLPSSQNDDANLVFDFAIPRAGSYRFTMRSRSGQGNDPSEPPNDVWLKVPGQEWLKVYMLRDGSWQTDAIGERNGTHSREFNTYELGTGAIQITVSGRSQGHIIDWAALEPQGVVAPVGPSAAAGTGVMNTNYQPGDLLIIAHDSGPDTDDMQAIVANRAIMDANPTVNYLLVGATQGHKWTNPTAGSEAHTQSLFPDWINAKASTSGTTSFDGTSVIKIADKAEKTLSNGGTVHIAEGGPSDFTAEIIRVLQSRGVSAADVKRIRVVQHSAGSTAWNEQETRGSNLSLVKSAATWVPIANGNVGGNATADFQEPASSGMCQRFMRSASGSKYAAQWAWAYSTIGDSRKCDQSDSVELLFILNDTSTRTFDQFSSRYL